jgi:protein-S-isoprenylcysteine O-methyltransferase Ste14
MLLMKEKKMSVQIQKNYMTKKAFWTVAIFYMLIAFEFFYMASPFAAYFYSIYGPGLNFMNENQALAWVSSYFLPHLVVETSSLLLGLHEPVGIAMAILGFLAFCIGAIQVYYYKLVKKGAVTGGIYNYIRHPQYASLAICSFGLLLLWPRYIVLLSFVAMLFVYYFLAKLEERECEERFGQSYIDYKNKTNMFLPIKVPGVNKLHSLPKSGLKRYLAVAGLYLLTATVSITLANGLRDYSLKNLYALYTKEAAYVSISKVDQDDLKRIVAIALADKKVQGKVGNLKENKSTKFLNYVIPTEWYVSEIPMKIVPDAKGGHYHPANYDKNLYKIVFTKVDLRTDKEVEGKELILNVIKRTPIAEVKVDLTQNSVSEIVDPATTIKYVNIPVALY